MPTLDPRTILFVTAMMGPLIALVLIFLRRSYPRHILGMDDWAGGALVVFAGGILIGARGLIPEFVSVVVGNGCILSGLLLLNHGSQRFFEVTSTTRYGIGLVAASVGALAWFQAVTPSFKIRVLIVSLTAFALIAQHAWLIAQYRDRHRFAGRFMMLALAGACATWLCRMILAASGSLSEDLFAPNIFNTVINLLQTLFSLLVLIGFLLLAPDRLRGEFELLASIDSLTGALTRRTWDEAIQRELVHSRRHHRPLSVLMMDLDHFKQINDRYGHAVGDQILIDFVQRANGQLRSLDRLGRYGGEEFVVLLPETAAEAAKGVAERIRGAVAAAAINPPYTASIGVATLADEHTTLTQLLARADVALYRAKEQGRNQIQFE